MKIITITTEIYEIGDIVQLLTVSGLSGLGLAKDINYQIEDIRTYPQDNYTQDIKIKGKWINSDICELVSDTPQAKVE